MLRAHLRSSRTHTRVHAHAFGCNDEILFFVPLFCFHFVAFLALVPLPSPSVYGGVCTRHRCAWCYQCRSSNWTTTIAEQAPFALRLGAKFQDARPLEVYSRKAVNTTILADGRLLIDYGTLSMHNGSPTGCAGWYYGLLCPSAPFIFPPIHPCPSSLPPLLAALSIFYSRERRHIPSLATLTLTQ